MYIVTLRKSAETEAKAELSFVEPTEANWIDSLRLLNLRNRTAFQFS